MFTFNYNTANTNFGKTAKAYACGYISKEEREMI